MTDITLGKGRKPGSAILRTVAFPADGLWSMHVLGDPGSGKTAFLGNLTEQFATAGEGVLLIDIKGDLAPNVLLRTQKPPEDVIYIAPGKLDERYWGLNPFEFARTERRLNQVYAEALPELFARIGYYDPSFMARIEKLLSNAVMLALAERAPTLLDMFLIIHYASRRRELLERDHVHPLAWQYFTHVFDNMNERDQRGMIDSTDSRLRQMINSKYMNYMLGQQQSTIRFKEWLDAGKLVICDLNQGEMGERSAPNMANLFLGQIAALAVQRPTGQVAHPWRIIVDEFHELATEPFARMVTQLRTYSVYPVVAHQNMSQLDDKSRSLRAAAEQCRVRVKLSLSETDLDTMRWRRGAEVAQEQAAIEQYTAEVSHPFGPRGTRLKERVRLSPWKEDVQQGRLSAALERQEALTQPKRKLTNLRTLFDQYGTKEGAHDQQKHHHSNRGRRTGQEAPGARPLRQEPRHDLSAGDDPAGVPDAGGTGQISFLDLATGGAPAVPAPADQQGHGQKRRRRAQGGQ